MINYLIDKGLKLSLEIAKILVKARVKPMTVTVLRFIVAAPVSWFFFSRGEYFYNVVGLLIYIVLAILDWVDGDMALLYKLPKRTAPFGRLIDHTLDRILMLVVLGAIFYAGIKGPNGRIWAILTVIYYNNFFFLTVLLYEFDKIFGLNFERYPEIKQRADEISKPSIIDIMLFNLLHAHNNSWTQFLFSVSFPLFIGIITNQLLITFIFITTMHLVRSIGVYLIMHQTLNLKPTNSALVKILRKYII